MKANKPSAASEAFWGMIPGFAAATIRQTPGAACAFLIRPRFHVGKGEDR
jgi:hypothetical protein